MLRGNIPSRPPPITREQSRCDSATWAVARRLDACYNDPGILQPQGHPLYVVIKLCLPATNHQPRAHRWTWLSSSFDLQWMRVVSHPRTPLSSSCGGNAKPAHGCLLPTALSDGAKLALSPATFYYILASSVICQVCASSPLHHRSAAVADNDVDRISHDSSSAL